ncbi:MAG TPA: DinB family protein [Acidobacteriaceae bacterium]|nr:DinB family protein [Acidobacteriaceae bacterium]
MRRLWMMAGLCLALAAPAALIAQDSGGQSGAAAPATIAPADSLNALMGMLQMEVVSAAEAMPADKYDFAPTNGDFKGVRNFGSQVKHLAEANYEFFHGWDVPGATEVDPKTIEALKTKDDIVKALKDSYTYAHAAVSTITPQNAFDSVKGFPPQFKETRATAAAFAIAHSMDHYGQLVEYLRMNGIIPPASRPQPKGSSM